MTMKISFNHAQSIAAFADHLYQQYHGDKKPAYGLAPITTHPHTILVIMDGLGENLLEMHGAGSFIAAAKKDTLESLLPSATVPSISSFATGAFPLAHGNLGWYTYLDHNDILPTTPFTLKKRGHTEANMSFASHISPPGTGFNALPVPRTIVQHEAIAHSIFSTLYWDTPHRPTYSTHNPEELVTVLEDLFSITTPHVSVVYWSELDHLSHQFGWTSSEVREHFLALDRVLASVFAKKPASIQIALTADHGQVEVPQEHWINLGDYPNIASLLKKPLSGEPRFAFAHVQEGATTAFLDHVAKELDFCCTALPVTDALAQELFGPAHTAHPEIRERLGDVLLLPKDTYAVFDTCAGSPLHYDLGVHGGITSGERFVPLCIWS